MRAQPDLQRKLLAEPSRRRPPGVVDAVGEEVDRLVRVGEGHRPRSLKAASRASSAQQPGGQGSVVERPIAIVHPEVLRDLGQLRDHVSSGLERQVFGRRRQARS